METGSDGKIKVTFLVNAAVLLEFRGTKLLLDGIYGKRGHCFSNLTEGQWDAMRKGEGIFSNIAYLLFTHEHGDHLMPERVAEYLDGQRPKAIFLPKQGSRALKALQEKAGEMEIPCALLEESICRNTVFKPEPDIRIKAFPTRHLDKLYWDVPHFCYLIALGGKKLFFTADVDFTYETFPALKGQALDAVFINPLMRHSKEGRRLFSEGALQAERQVVYHIPFAGDDSMQVRRLAEREMHAQEESGGNTVFFMERGQGFLL